MGEPGKREPIKWTDIAVVVLTGGIMIAAGLQTYIFDRQRQEMTGAGSQTDRIIEADDRLAAANERFAGAMEQTVTDNKTALDKTVQENRKALASTLAQGRESLDASIASFHLDQRPWVFARSFALAAEPELNKELTVKIFVANTGKTPAIDLIPESQVALQFSCDNLDPVEIIRETKSRGILPPDRAILVSELNGWPGSRSP